MGILDEAKDRLAAAAGRLKDRAGQVGGGAQGTGHSLGERAADAKHWVTSRVGGAQRAQRSGGGGDFATEWVDASKDDDLGGPQADGAVGGQQADGAVGGPQADGAAGGQPGGEQQHGGQPGGERPTGSGGEQPR